jgi:hypothetical protein
VLVCALAGLGGTTFGSAPLAAQTGEPPPTREERLQARQDSILARMQEQLLLLGRAPGADSATIAADSARLAGPARQQGTGASRMQSQDSIVRALLELAGYTPTYYVGSEAVYDTGEGQLILFGDSTRPAQTLRDGTELSAAEQLVYDDVRGQIRTVGVATLSRADGAPTTAAGLTVDTETELASALGARTLIQQNAEWYLTGDLPLVYSEGGWGHDLQFTTCELDEPHYHFRAKEVKFLRGADSVLVARNVTLRFAEVPVLWLPFFAQNTGSGRRSGLLTPTFSVNDIVRSSGSYNRRLSNLGYYWAVSDYMDASASFDWFSGNYTALNGSFRYSWQRQFLRGAANVRRYWRSDGGSELTLATQHDWDISERTSFRASARFATSTDFVTQNSFDPREVTGSINSEGGFQRRFDWGQFSLSGSRRQFLNDDRIETQFPQASLSLRSITLLRASPAQARWYNNMAIGGNVRVNARSTDRSQEPGVYVAGQEDLTQLNGSASTSLNLGRFSLSPSLSLDQGTRSGIPFDSLPFFADVLAQEGAGALISRRGITALTGGPYASAVSGDLVDVTRTTLDWNVSAGYQQTLVSSTTLTPRVSLSSTWLRSDTVDVAQDFVASPTRVSFGAQLRGDLYAFFPGFGGFDQIRHKVSPSFSYDYAPATDPTELQTRVFGAGATRAQNVLAVTLNQTFEAKRRPEEGEEGDSTGARSAAGGTGELLGGDGEELRRLEQGEVISLFALRTSAIQYDFVEADSTGRFIDGFRTTSVSNTLSSDLLAGFSVQMQHDLFDQDAGGVGRTFSPKLTRLNFGFRLDNNSPVANLFGLLGRGGAARTPEDAAADSAAAASLEDPFFEGQESEFAGGSESSIVPEADDVGGRRPGQGFGGSVGRWSADLQYALTRSRSGVGGSQTIQARFQIKPTELWEMSWATGYDIDTGEFSDHRIRLTRDLHRWDANFDFVQTATGNWSFRFEVRLTDQEDLKFDYEQRSLQDGFFDRFPN